MPRALRILLALVISLVPHCIHGAEISLGEDDVGQLWLQVIGRIDDGDDAKFRGMLVDAINRQEQIINVSIYSPGGSTIPAMKIGRYIRTLHLTTVAPESFPFLTLRVCRIYARSGKPIAMDYDPLTGRGDPRCTCESECFLMWAAGTARLWSGVDLARLSLQHEQAPGAVVEQPDMRSQAAVTDYLREMGIPESTIARAAAMAPGQSEHLTADEKNLLETKTGLPRFDEPFRSRCRVHKPTSPAQLGCERAISRELYWAGAKRLLNEPE